MAFAGAAAAKPGLLDVTACAPVMLTAVVLMPALQASQCEADVMSHECYEAAAQSAVMVRRGVHHYFAELLVALYICSLTTFVDSQQERNVELETPHRRLCHSCIAGLMGTLQAYRLLPATGQTHAQCNLCRVLVLRTLIA